VVQLDPYSEKNILIFSGAANFQTQFQFSWCCRSLILFESRFRVVILASCPHNNITRARKVGTGIAMTLSLISSGMLVDSLLRSQDPSLYTSLTLRSASLIMTKRDPSSPFSIQGSFHRDAFLFAIICRWWSWVKAFVIDFQTKEACSRGNKCSNEGICAERLELLSRIEYLPSQLA